MSTYRERRLARAERLREWAAKRAARSDGNFKRAHYLVKDIPLGQPILVGHHSERRHRRTLEKSDNAMRRAVEDDRMSKSMESRADNIEGAAHAAIYNDDPDAVERLTARIAELEAERTRMKLENAAYRKGPAAYAAFLGISSEAEAAIRLKIEAGYSWCRQPHPAYSLQNLGGQITRYKKRLAFLNGRPAPKAAPIEAASATARAGLTVHATMTTPSRPGKQPRPVWNVTGDYSDWRRAVLIDLGGSWYRGVFSFWTDPTAELEAACLTKEQHHTDPADPCEGRTIWNSDGTDGPVLICPPPEK